MRQRNIGVEGEKNYVNDSEDPNYNGDSNHSNGNNEDDQRHSVNERRPNKANGRIEAVGSTSLGGSYERTVEQNNIRSREHQKYRQHQRKAGNRSTSKTISALKPPKKSIGRKNESLSSTSPPNKQVGSRRNDEFFSSSSSSEEDDDYDGEGDSDYSEENSSLKLRHRGRSSEFDKAVRSGQGPRHSELSQQRQQIAVSSGHQNKSQSVPRHLDS